MGVYDAQMKRIHDQANKLEREDKEKLEKILGVRPEDRKKPKDSYEPQQGAGQ